MTRTHLTRNYAILAAILLGVPAGAGMGVGAYTFVYAKGASYMGNDPATCANCHVMQGHYDAWAKSSHHAVAVCNDCHTPHDFIGKYYTKGVNGYHHSLAFTTQRFQEPIMIKTRNREVTEQACRHCHAEMTSMIEGHAFGATLECLHCHSSVGHLR